MCQLNSGNTPYLNFRRSSSGDIFHTYRTLLYITHKNAFGENYYAVYGFDYGFEFSRGVSPEELEHIRSMYFGHLQQLFESVPVEELKLCIESAFMHILYELRMFIDGQMHINGVNMYLSNFQVSPLFDMFGQYPNNQGLPSLGFTVFQIENGISRPATPVIVIDESTIVLPEEGILF